jgi:hypothetical protein
LQDVGIPPRPAAVAAAVAVALTAGVIASLWFSSSPSPDPAPARTPSPAPSETAAVATTAGHAPPSVALDPPARRRFPPRAGLAMGVEATRPGADGARTGPESSGGWWLGTAGVALALALVGWGSVASRRYLPRGGSGPLAVRVVGRASLSPRHSVYLVEVGGRVLIVATGPQGAPALLGELTDPADPARADGLAAPPRFDRRLGDEP